MENTKDLPLYDFENDERISDARKTACKIDYTEMELYHLDKIYTSAYQYDKKTGKPIAKKPKSIHELTFFLLRSCQALTGEIDQLKHEIKELKAQQSAA